MAAQPQARVQDPPLIEDGGISLELDYWLARNTPTTRGGSGAYDYYVSDLVFPGQSKYAPGAMLSFPAGKQNSLRFSYFRVQGQGETTLSQPLTLYTTDYAAGDQLNNNYLIQGAKLSWDYLSYTFRNPGRFNGVRFKTLYELQFVTIRSTATRRMRRPSSIPARPPSSASLRSLRAAPRKCSCQLSAANWNNQWANTSVGKCWHPASASRIMALFGMVKPTSHCVSEKQRRFSVIVPSTLRRLHRPLISTTRKRSRALSLGSATICFAGERSKQS